MERRIFHLSQKTKKPFKASRLQFTEEERADPTLEKPKIGKSGRQTGKGTNQDTSKDSQNQGTHL